MVNIEMQLKFIDYQYNLFERRDVQNAINALFR